MISASLDQPGNAKHLYYSFILNVYKTKWCEKKDVNTYILYSGGLEYSILSPQDAINLAEVRVSESSTYNLETGKTVHNGPLDLRMG